MQRLALTKPYTIAYKTIEDTEVVFLEIILGNGIIGRGAANPFAEVVGETPATTLSRLQGDFLKGLVGRDISQFNQMIDESKLEFPHLPGTQAAIDIALHDAFCQFLNISVLDFYGQKIKPIPTSITIGIKDTDSMIEEAKANFAAGFRVMKIKTGLDVEQDIERVKKITECFGGAVLVRADANQGYSLGDLKKFIAETAGLNIELVEQPLAVGEDWRLKALAEDERKFLVADESLLDADSAISLTHKPLPYGVFNIKLMKCGGIKGAMEIAAIAKHAGISLFWGCNDESIISITAALHAALSSSNTRYLDLDGSFDINETGVSGGFTLRDGVMYPNGLPGLGVQKK